MYFLIISLSGEYLILYSDGWFDGEITIIDISFGVLDSILSIIPISGPYFTFVSKSTKLIMEELLIKLNSNLMKKYSIRIADDYLEIGARKIYLGNIQTDSTISNIYGIVDNDLFRDLIKLFINENYNDD